MAALLECKRTTCCSAANLVAQSTQSLSQRTELLGQQQSLLQSTYLQRFRANVVPGSLARLRYAHAGFFACVYMILVHNSLPSSWLELTKPLGCEVKCLQGPETCSVAYDLALRITMTWIWKNVEPSSTFFTELFINVFI